MLETTDNWQQDIMERLQESKIVLKEDAKDVNYRMEGRVEAGASLDRCLCNHAEANAIMHCAILGIEAGVEGAVLYTTFVPCLECYKNGNHNWN